MRRLFSALLLICLLGYALIPHEGDFLDLFAMSTGVSAPSLRVSDGHGQTLTPFQAVLRGLPTLEPPTDRPIWRSMHTPAHPDLYVGLGETTRVSPPALAHTQETLLPPLPQKHPWRLSLAPRARPPSAGFFPHTTVLLI